MSVKLQSVERLRGLKSAIEAKTEETYHDLTEAVQGLSDKVVDITDTASGETILLTDSADAPIRGLAVYGKSTQDGTPTPDAPVPIVSVGEDGVTDVGVYGKNLLLCEYREHVTNGITFTPNADGSISVRGTATESAYYRFNKAVKLPSGQYKLSGCAAGGSGARYALQIYDAKADGSVGPAIGNEYGTGLDLRFDRERRVMGYIVVRTGTNVDGLVFRPSLVCSDSYDGQFYKPVDPQVLPIATPNGLCGIPVASGGNYTDENGQQWVCDEIDFVRGVKVQRITTIQYNAKYSATLATGETYAYLQVEGKVAKAMYGLMCDRAKAVYKIADRVPNTIYENDSNIVIVGNIGDTLADMRTKFDGSTVQYILAEPIETPLTEEELSAYAVLRMNYPNTTIYADDNAWLSVAYRAEAHENGIKVGKKAEYDAFWDTFQNYGNRTSSSYMFAYDGWTDETFCPKYDLKPKSGNFMFAYNGYTSKDTCIVDLKGCLEKAGIILDTSGCAQMNNMFYTSYKITRLPAISFESATQCANVFSSCDALVSIDKLIFKSDGTTDLTNTSFGYCTKLQRLSIEGVIGRSLSFSASSLLTVDSMVSIISHLMNYKGTDNEGTCTIKFHDTAWSRLEDTTPPDGYSTWKDYVMDLGWNV